MTTVLVDAEQPQPGRPASGVAAEPVVLLVAVDPSGDVARELAGAGLEVVTCLDHAEALLVVGEKAPDVVVLTPDVDLDAGTTFLGVLRRRHTMPVIVGVGSAAPVDAVALLDAGATACVAWPFRVPELLPILRAAHRTLSPDVLTVGPVELRMSAHEVRVSGAPIDLPLREFQLLAFLMAHAGTVVTRRQIIEAVWGAGYAGETNTLTVHIGRLRQRLGDHIDEPKLIQAVRGLGYRLALLDDMTATAAT
ncbi:MAG: response regulator [Streptosporangiales bacterium]|nr:response regulator [Streptosporangiales bacterium]